MAHRLRVAQPDLDIFDGLQLAEGAFAANFVFAWIIRIVTNGQRGVVFIALDQAVDGSAIAWTLGMAIYTALCFTCLYWRNDLLQTSLAVFSVGLWLFIGSVILLLDPRFAVAGIFPLELSVISGVSIYYRGMYR